MSGLSRCLTISLVIAFCGLAFTDQIFYISSGKVYTVNLANKIPEVLIEPPADQKIISILVLPTSKSLVYSLGAKTKGKSASSIWMKNLSENASRELLKTDFSGIKLCDLSLDEKRILFQAQAADSFTVGYLNLQSGKLLQLQSAYSPRFLTNTKILVLAEPSRPGFCYHILGCWDVVKEKLDTLAYTPETCNRVLGISSSRNLLALVRSDAGTQMNEYIDIVDTSGQIAIPQAARSSGLIRILGGPTFSPGNKQLAWVAEHWLMVTDLQTRETKRIVERLMTDDFAWSPYGGEILIAFSPPENPKKCSTCPPNLMKYRPGLFTVNQAGDAFERVALMWGAVKQIFWVR